MDDKDVNSMSALLVDFNAKISDLEEKNNLLKERVLLLGKTLLKQEQRINVDIETVKEDVRNINNTIERIKEGLQHLLKETSYFARKEELTVLQRYMKIWEPLKFVKEDEVRRIIQEELENKKKSNKNPE
ncbi:hypothetical protein CO154_00775 [Candidatus Pacearchaeota archaeon CG_4_9_14_3_um_filter_31_7]|nr:MAG: hypothetical protein AUJ10_02465 [Candidatus Pacearchaeota archaeon CG1_02_31_27]PIN92488.1 MAG: hypothetical protein COU55_01640 [Candidatus Pacearchaeota archaeon CG10_big_fil_rev_8_21_14_0_10_31_59]PIZ80804.1 MAG: hypothetical protein COX99_01465 [Candidatus Pacearchaeota archaeon CG_4_10_14_0_2_um_filter_31_10]PJA70836.1 MAG: hypothetical protein CO154_00775 [Candidatus Pacearchaeota archaeon CG_4_9_14_3_um_filter_31_7]